MGNRAMPSQKGTVVVTPQNGIQNRQVTKGNVANRVTLRYIENHATKSCEDNHVTARYAHGRDHG